PGRQGCAPVPRPGHREGDRNRDREPRRPEAGVVARRGAGEGSRAGLMPAARFTVSGRVQGVCFRAGARTQAVGLGLRGYARNLSDGTVEVLAVGEAQAIEALAPWLDGGPPLARADGTSREDLMPAPRADAGFQVV